MQQAAVREEWVALMNRWNTAEQKAREAQAECMAALTARVRGTGPGPTQQQINQADKLRGEADDLRLLADTLIRKHFGT